MRRNDSFYFQFHAAFTLLEVVVALAIVGGVIVGLLVARERAVTTCVSARSTMATARMCAALAARVRSGELGEGTGIVEEQGEFPWRIVRENAPSSVPTTVQSYLIEVLPPDGDVLNGCTLYVWRYEPNAGEGATP